ncbi:MAG: DMT family transporter [Candidatus Diapherotrites archaeon]
MKALNRSKGLQLVFLTAIISGFSIFLNKFGVQETNPFIYTFLKNLVVAALLFSVILLFKDFKALKALSRKQWAKLFAIGAIGGSVPFLLYFYALKLTSAVNAGFIHKTIFIFASLMALFFLKEKLSKWFVLGAGLLLAANFILFSKISSFNYADLLILGAVVFWAAENVLSKHVLEELSGNVVAFGRMFFGSALILSFLLISGNFSALGEIGVPQIEWILLTSALLFGYVFTYYNGLKHISVSSATAILLLGQPITAVLSMVFLQKTISAQEAMAFVLLVSGIALIVFSSRLLTSLKAPFKQVV